MIYPSQRICKHENKTGYKLIYMRWVCHCYAPKFCLTLPYTENCVISSVPDVKTYLIQPLARLCSLLEDNIDSDDMTSIWDPYFQPSLRPDNHVITRISCYSQFLLIT
ncbi:unnamed protein product [Heterobilharzia americana]|nr:unnamed protein product [Heterobilharzia americana]